MSGPQIQLSKVLTLGLVSKLMIQVLTNARGNWESDRILWDEIIREILKMKWVLTCIMKKRQSLAEYGEKA